MPVELVDTHCHLDFDRFDEDRPAVIQRANQAGVVRIVVPALDLATSKSIVALAQATPQIYAAVGIHPNDLEHIADINVTLDTIRQLAEAPKVVAIGEIGLDYYWMKAPKPTQHEWLERQLEIASRVALPVILHNRETTDDLYTLLVRWVELGLPAKISDRPGVIHSFSGSWQDAQRFLELGFYLGFSGPLTYKKSGELREVAASAPADQILVETDAPFLTPEPYRSKRNEPSFVRHTAEKLAEIRGVDLETIARITTQNAVRLFDLNVARTSS
jgi:TatD DNase family protein